MERNEQKNGGRDPVSTDCERGAIVGFAIVGFAIVGVATVGLAIVGFAIVGYATAGFAIVGFADPRESWPSAQRVS